MAYYCLKKDNTALPAATYSGVERAIEDREGLIFTNRRQLREECHKPVADLLEKNVLLAGRKAQKKTAMMTMSKCPSLEHWRQDPAVQSWWAAGQERVGSVDW